MSGEASDIRVAFSHDWLNGMRGGEKCLEALSELYPDADIFTLFLDRSRVCGPLLRHPIHTSFLQRWPFLRSAYRYYLPFFPAAIGSLKPKANHLVVSTSHCVAKGIRAGVGSKHLCYCFTPMRYAWGFFDDYFGGRNFLNQRILRFLLSRLREWDVRANKGVDCFVAISEHVKKRIRQFYDRDADVIYPPVDTEFYTPEPSVRREEAYLIVSALVPYKKTDLAIRAMNRMGRKLVVIGDGPERAFLQRIAGAGVRFLGWQSDDGIRDHYRRARALIFPGEEDFGIVPVEAQSCGAHVIALARGGLLETVNAKTGFFFNKATESALIDAVERFESSDLDPADSRANAVRFGKRRFQEEMRHKILKLMSEKK